MTNFKGGDGNRSTSRVVKQLIRLTFFVRSSTITFSQINSPLATGRSAILAPPDPVILQRELVVLAERVALPVLREQNPRQVRVAGEPDAAQVVGLALVPVGRLPQARHGRHLGQRTGL